MTAPIFIRARATANRLLAPNRMGNANITITRRTRVPPENSWEDPTWTTQSETLRAQAFGVKKEWIGSPAGEGSGPVIVASDRYVIAALPAMSYEAGDVVSIDGNPVTVLSVQPSPATSDEAVLRLIVR